MVPFGNKNISGQSCCVLWGTAFARSRDWCTVQCFYDLFININLTFMQMIVPLKIKLAISSLQYIHLLSKTKFIFLRMTSQENHTIVFLCMIGLCYMQNTNTLLSLHFKRKWESYISYHLMIICKTRQNQSSKLETTPEYHHGNKTHERKRKDSLRLQVDTTNQHIHMSVNYKRCKVLFCYKTPLIYYVFLLVTIAPV